MRAPFGALPSTRAARRLMLAPLVLAALAAQPGVSIAQRPVAAGKPRPAVAVFAVVHHGDTTRADTTALAHGVAALLESELSASRRLRVADLRSSDRARPALTSSTATVAAARSRGAPFALLAEFALVGDSVRVTARVLRTRDTTSISLDRLTAGRDDVPALVDDLAESVADSLAPRTDATRGGPIFRPPRPPVSFGAMALYSKAVAARTAGDADTAARLLREVVSVAPKWDQPRRDLAALRRRS